MGGSRQTQQTESKSAPWGPAQPALEGSIPQIENLYSQRMGQKFFPGKTYAGFDPSQEAALGGIESTAGNQISTGGLTGAASGYTGKVLAGDYLPGTEAGNQFMEGVLDPVQAALSSQWSKSGRGTGNYGASGVAADVGKGMTAAMAPYYEMERGRMEAAAGRAPQLDQAAYDPFAALYGAGSARQAMDQQGISEKVARFDFNQNKGANALAEKLNFLMGMGKMGGETSSITTGTTKPSVGQMVAGGALTAGGLAAANPFSIKSMLPWLNGGMMDPTTGMAR